MKQTNDPDNKHKQNNHIGENAMKKNNYFKTIIRCEYNDEGDLDFYMYRGEEEYFLFSQNYRLNVYDFYGRGISVEKAIDHSAAGNSVTLHKTMDKLFKVIRYVEKDESISVLNRTKMRKERKWA